MDKTLEQKFKARLEKELQTVEAELKSVGRINPNNPKDWEAVPDQTDIKSADPNEVADSIEAYEENTAILKQLEIRLNEIKVALERISNGTYGICRVCRKVIETERLDANQAATTCLLHRET